MKNSFRGLSIGGAKSLVLCAAVAVASLAPVAASAQSAKELVGTYTFVSSVGEHGGAKTDSFGAAAKGVLVFDTGGRYVITIVSAGLPKVASNNRTTGTADENKAIAGGALTHFGAYTVDEATNVIAFKIETSTFPNWDGVTLSRKFTLKGDELQYVTTAATAGGVATTTWRRAK